MDLVDFHSHIIPRADHGSDSVSTSLSQLKFAEKYGVSRIVATPHFYPHSNDVDSFLSRRRRGYDSLASAMGDNAPKVMLGAEVLYCDNLDKLPNLDKLCLGNSKILLLELPFTEFDRSISRTLEALIDDGYEVLLAHADRYPPEEINSILRREIKIQLNAISLCTIFKNRQLYDWIDNGLVVALGSDIHNTNEKAYRCFKRAQKKLGTSLDYIMSESNKMWQSIIKEPVLQ